MKTITNRVKTIIKPRKHSQAQRVRTEREIDLPAYAQMVEEKAYELYEQRGRQDGQDWEDWFQAEKIVEEELYTKKLNVS